MMIALGILVLWKGDPSASTVAEHAVAIPAPAPFEEPADSADASSDGVGLPPRVAIAPAPVVPGRGEPTAGPTEPWPPAQSGPPPPAATSRAEPEDATVTDSGWSSALPVALNPFTVPDRGLPVSAYLGRAAETSYLRVSGPGNLTLPIRSNEFGDPTVRACPITSTSWVAGPAMTADDAPDYDCSVGVEGVSGERQWTFDLRALDVSRGVALVPAGDLNVNFRVVFGA